VPLCADQKRVRESVLMDCLELFLPTLISNHARNVS